MGAFLPIVGAFAVFGLPASPSGVTVLGAVKSPGTISLSGPKSLSSAIERLGGLTLEADKHAISIRHSDGSTAQVNLCQLGTIPAVRPGDLVLVPKVDPSKYVFVQGGVASSGSLSFTKDMTLLDALLAARPVKGAGVEKILLHRPGPDGAMTTKTYNLFTLAAEPVALKPADRIEVPYASLDTMSDRQILTIVVIGLLIILLVR